MSSLFGQDYMRVGLGLVVGLAAIIYFNPPHSVCQSQVEFYNESVKSLLKGYNKSFKECKEHPEPGGCSSLMEALRKYEDKLKEVSLQCQPELDSDKYTRPILSNSMELLIRAAWGSKPPASYLYRNNWLELSHLVQYCRLRKHFITIFGDEALTVFNEMFFTDLPGANGMSRNDIWSRSILSDSCKYAF